ncbi:Chromatin assembly factor 1 subunit [Yamadazyma tenuis]|uniref:CAF1B/HIR1 beta-propeller domain-containing protein n=1 Tax=Candida tenuis (strain ATCC 10573 / BCRC 21748 / CBS 615 / JCM 9827 / NBRC 10315 / NRRL Y-1498 / VKM Y-70) TaxID=590646 RepID=G3B677_CANTC|nr:uncharacterized protein CANTEDRAFT_107062 [Yamadazyma tenuis ATCC 10573]EGV63404.1 hypothetical protein CANTEDRAFT_107062 [Yamadazyma tenuis ATCC 10573]WEJ96774.1 Chromatin assembly factor 1 subunit [Yamadazyma tenuis]
MNSSTITVHWHDANQPVYSVSFQPEVGQTSPSPRLATGGGDNNVRIWRLSPQNDKSPVQYLSSLNKHTQAVNCVRFSPDGTQLATAGDDGTVLIWTLSPTLVREFGEEDDGAVESWTCRTAMRASTSEIYDVCWSPCGRYVAAGSMDHAVRFYDVKSGLMVHQAVVHNHYIQGLAWDPLGKYVASQAADCGMCLYELGEDHDENSLFVTETYKSYKADVPGKRLSEDPTATTKHAGLYHSETLQSFFRRPAFSPDGNLLATAAGVYRPEADDETNTVYISVRTAFHRPVVHLPGLKRPAVAVQFSPLVYERSTPTAVFDLAYKMVFAVVTQDSVVVYDTERLEPLGVVSNVHYSTITDLAWDRDGQRIMVSSADGFCSVVRFDEGIFGKVVDLVHPSPPAEVRIAVETKVVDTPEPASPEKSSETPDKSPGPSIINLLQTKKKEKKRVAPTPVETVDLETH